MYLRSRIALCLGLLIAVIAVIPVFAGGWAVIVLDELPAGIVAGKPLTLGFTVLQHGRTPMTDLEPTVTASSLSGDAYVVNAEPEGKAGHYVATLTFPKEGKWEWSIQAFSMDQPMPALSVAAPAVASLGDPLARTKPGPVDISPIWIVRALAFGIGLLGLVIAFQRKSRLAGVLTVSCLVVGLASFMTGATVPAAEAESKSSIESSLPQVEYGQQLFVVKGCVTCHVNNRVPNRDYYQTIDMGAPDLSNFSASPEALRLRLRNPALVKSDTQMPNLNLSDPEIEALIAFINSK